MAITIDEDLFNLRLKIIEMANAARSAIAYFKCVRESGGDWTNADCLGLTRRVTLPDVVGPIGELLAEMPEEEQQQVDESFRAAHERLLQRYDAELQEAIRQF